MEKECLYREAKEITQQDTFCTAYTGGSEIVAAHSGPDVILHCFRLPEISDEVAVLAGVA